MSEILNLDFSDITKLFTDSARTSAVSANNDPIGGVTGIISGKNGSQANSGERGLYKTSIINSLSTIKFDGSNDSLEAPLDLTTATALSLYLIFKSIEFNQLRMPGNTLG